MAPQDYSINNNYKSNPYLMNTLNLNTEGVNRSQGIGQVFGAKQVVARNTEFSGLPKNNSPVVTDLYNAEELLA